MHLPFRGGQHCSFELQISLPIALDMFQHLADCARESRLLHDGEREFWIGVVKAFCVVEAYQHF